MSDPKVLALSPAVDVSALPEYPIPLGTRLDGHSWFQFHHTWYHDSEFRRCADEVCRAVWLDMIVAAQFGDPVGTLPVDQGALAWKARMPLERWIELSRRPYGPLYGWRQCRISDGSVRLYHPRLLEVTESAARAKIEAAARRASDRERKRLAELPAKVLAAGGSTRMAEDAGYIARLDAFMQDTMPVGVSRTVGRVREAMEAMG